MPSPAPSIVRPSSPAGRLSTGAAVALAVVFVALVAARAALPSLIEWRVNRSLASNAQVTGHIGDVTVSLWRGAYRIRDVELRDARHRDRDPFLSARAVDFSVDMSELIRRRRVLAKSRLVEPVVNLATLPRKKNAAEAKEGAGEVKKAVVPVDVSRIEVTSGTVYMPALIAGGAPVKADRVFLVGQNLFKTGGDVAREPKNSAALTGTARLPGNGALDLDLRFDPVAKPPSFSVKVKLEGMDLAALNPVLKPETGIDLKKGTGNLYAEIESRDGRFEGYVKPILQGIEVAPGEKGESLGTRVKKKVVSVVTNVVRNEKKDSVASRVPLSGSLDNPSAGVWASVRMTLRHAYVRAIRPGLEGAPSSTAPKRA